METENGLDQGREYVRRCRDEGRSDEEIARSLAAAGWTPEQVAALWSSLHAEQLAWGPELPAATVPRPEAGQPIVSRPEPPAAPGAAPQPTWAIWSLVLGIIGLTFCQLAPPFAIWAGVTSNRRG